MPEGRIIKALSGYYDVLEADGAIVRCRARGLMRKNGLSPLVGDRVVFEVSVTGEGTVREILPRTNELLRPPVANVELAVLVFAVKEPDPNLQLLDKFLVHIERAGLETAICFSKLDLADKDPASERLMRELVGVYRRIGYETAFTSAVTGGGLDWIRSRLNGKISVLAGQSGVGKSSLINVLLPDADLKTGEISRKLGRGRHTTRHTELIPLPEGGFVADTPGFSQLDFLEMEPEALGSCFREFVPLIPACKFRGCLHLREPGCAVRQAVEAGQIAKSRYDNYAMFVKDMQERKARRY